MHLAVVVCGKEDRAEETVVNIKSSVMFSKQVLKVHIFAEDHLKNLIRSRFDLTGCNSVIM